MARWATPTTSARTMSPTASMPSSSTPKTPPAQTLWVCGTRNMADATYGGINFNAGKLHGSKYSAHFGPPESSRQLRHLVRRDSLRQLAEQRPGQWRYRERGLHAASAARPRPATAIASRGTPERPCFFPAKTSGTRQRTTTRPPVRISSIRPAATRLPTATAPRRRPTRRTTITAVGNLTDVGAYTGTTSPYGAFDMGGNVFQWNEAFD